jgi:chromosome segregation ATPase
MPTLRQKVDSFCKEAGAKVESTDKLRAQITSLKAELKKAKETHKNHMKQMKAASKTVKAPKVAKAPKAPKVAKAPKVKQEVAMNPLPAEETAEQRSRRLEGEMGPGGYGNAATTAGRRTRRRL